ncbi:CbtA family protein [Methylopila sp. 73B]|uniref:CbtA family protein n=1 Tax=Methylopila sp. 73B TaxID=1120792 RepID=UPI00037D06F5|nr:CbtA family protein [Methylopila sp. 73B]
MVGRLLLKGMLAGLIAGLLTFCVAKIYGEPWVERAIAYEEQQAVAESASAGADEAEVEIVSRETQAGIGLLTGVLVYGAAVGGLFALAFAVANGRLGALDPQGLSLLLAAAAFVALVAVPMLKYPPNPPAVGSGDTIGARTELYFIAVGISLLAATAALMIAERLRAGLGGWSAAFAGSAVFLAATGLLLLGLPAVNEIPENYSAETVWNFRVASFAGLAVFWCALGVVFGLLASHRAPRIAAAPDLTRAA